MAANTKDAGKLPVNGCDIFLLEQWDANSPLPPDEQMTRIFARFLELPFSERQAYRKKRPAHRAKDLPQTEQSILSLARPFNERNPGDYLWLRTYYGPGSDAVFSAIVDECRGMLGPSAQEEWTYSDPARYDFGEEWKRIFGRMPQLLEYEGRDDYEARCAARLAEGQENERLDKAQVEEEGGEYPEDAAWLGSLYNYWHLACKVGVIYVLDEVTLGAAEKGEGEEDVADRLILVAWYDPNGKTVRWHRRTASQASQEAAVVNSAAIDDSPAWTGAEIGDDYDWDGPFGPPPLEDSESGTDGDEG